MKYIHREKGPDKMNKIWHAHDGYMVLYIYSSGGSLVTSERTYPIKRGTLALVAPGKYHYTMPTDPENYERSKLFLTEAEAKKCFDLVEFFECTRGGLVYADLPEKDMRGAEEILCALGAAVKNKKYENAASAAAFIRFAVLCDMHASYKEEGASDAMSMAIRFINDNIYEPITVDDVAKTVSMSKYHFCRSFKKHVGFTVMEYILKTRIMLSKNMLLSSNATVLEVSESCGFSSVSYFCRAFKSDVGVTPLKYRKESKSNYKR